MRVTVALLLFLLGFSLLGINAPRPSPSLGAVMGQTTPNPTGNPPTVDERRLAIDQLNDSAPESALNEAIKSSRDIHYPAGEAKALLLLSELQNLNKNHATAVLTAQQALAIWKSQNDKAGIARAYDKIGTYYLAQNMVGEASRSFAQALALWRGLNDRTNQASALTSLGYIEIRKADWEAGVSYFSQAYPLLDEQAEPVEMGRIATGLGASYLETGSLELATIQFQRALDLYRRGEDRIGIGYATRALGLLSFLSGDLNQAVSYLEQALDAFNDLKLGIAYVNEILGRVRIERGEYAAALKDLESALTIYTEKKNPNEAARVRALLGRSYDRQGQWSHARAHYQEALKAFIGQQDRVNQSAVYYALGKLEMKLRDYDAASAHLQQSIEVTEGVRRGSTSADLMSAFSASVQERYEAYIECLMKLHEKQPTRGFAVKAFETSELGRARTLSEMLFAMQTNLAPGVDPKLAARQKFLQQTIRIKENDRIKLLTQTAKPEKLKALEEEIGRLEADYKNVNDTIRSRFPAYDEISRPTAWDLRRIKENVLGDDDAVLLEYILGAENSYAWTITRDQFTTHKLGPQEDINKAVRLVYELLSSSSTTGNENELNKAIANLSKLVLTPVATALNKSRIILVADGPLNYIPFQLLLNNGEPLITSYEIVNVPSASILGQLRQEKQQRRPGTRVLAVFGDPVFASNYNQFKDANASELVTAASQRAVRDVELDADKFDPNSIQPLLYSKLELKNLTDIAGAKSVVMSGFDASRDTLNNLDLSQYSIVHFATHGRLDPTRPEHSGIYLSMVDTTGNPQDGFITTPDVFRLHAPVDLVVLSACRTGLGKDVRGEGLIGLTRGFMYAGASSVVASLWKVDDEATAELMKHFYLNMLQKGMRPAEALRAAQNTLRLNPAWQSPHFWAGFILQGEFKEPIRLPAPTGAPRAVQNAVGGALLLMLLIGIGWGFRRRR